MVHARDGVDGQPLHHACANGQVAIARWLLSVGARPDGSAATGDQPLHLACVCGHLEIAKILVHAGAPLHVRPKNDHLTPLGIARRAGHTELADWLAEGDSLRPFLASFDAPFARPTPHPILRRRAFPTPPQRQSAPSARRMRPRRPSSSAPP